MARVTMVLIQGPDHPAGNLDDRLEMQVGLNAQGLLDASAWETGRTPWLSSRTRPDHPRRDGELVKLEDGWAIRNLEREDDPLLGFAGGIMRPGEVARVVRLDGEELVYRIVAVDAD